MTAALFFVILDISSIIPNFSMIYSGVKTVITPYEFRSDE